VSGILAICLGEGFSLEKCETLFKSLSTKLEEKAIFKRIYEFVFGNSYNVVEFEKCIKESLGYQQDFMLAAIHNLSPKVFVISADTTSLLEPILIGSYSNGKRFQPKITPFFKKWEAALATSAMFPIFDPIEKDGKLLMDGSVLVNNPSEISINEVYNIWGFNSQIDLLLSLGTSLISTKNTRTENYARLVFIKISFDFYYLDL
jgi:hypothetical protein